MEIAGQEDDVLVASENLNCALHKDEVEIELSKKKLRGKTTGKVLSVKKRSKTDFSGKVIHKNGKVFLKPDDIRFYADILLISGAEKASDGDKAVVTLESFNNPLKPPEGLLIQIIGKHGENDAEMRSIIFSKGFTIEFPDEVASLAKRLESEAVKETEKETARRKDFRAVPTWTIDPVDAKDFDDAISLRELGNNRYEIGVHIADVSHYVRPNSVLDREASKRSFSVYLPDRVVPMLPEELSNNVCSLREGEDRLAFSAVFECEEKNGIVKIGKRWFGKTVIRSLKRLTYERAEQAITGKMPEFANEFKTLNRIAESLRRERFKKGAIDFDSDEVVFELDTKGVPIGIRKKERLASHKLVEEFMLLANREVAEFMKKPAGEHVNPFLYRIHDLPDKEKIAELLVLLRALGHHLPTKGKTLTPKDFQELFDKVQNLAEEPLVKTATLRSMAKAVYSTKNIGHFGLAFEYYTHFTSPIRRYPDLLVHRLLEAKLGGGQKITKWQSKEMEERAIHATEREISSAEAEREAKKYKYVEYMKNHIGEDFDAVISGVSEWGIFVSDRKTLAEGMVRIRSLKPDDYYTLQKSGYGLVGNKTKKGFTVGDTLRVRLIGADLAGRTLDFELA